MRNYSKTDSDKNRRKKEKKENKRKILSRKARKFRKNLTKAYKRRNC